MKQQEILAKLAAGEISAEDANKLLIKANEKPITFKVSEKRAVSVYGLQRMPVTLYKAQWKRLLSHADEILAFIDANDASLAEKTAA